MFDDTKIKVLKDDITIAKSIYVDVQEYDQDVKLKNYSIGGYKRLYLQVEPLVKEGTYLNVEDEILQVVKVIKYQDCLEVFASKVAEDVKLNDIAINLIIENDYNKEFDYKSIITNNKINTGDIIGYQDDKWLVLSEVEKSKTFYRLRIRKSNYNMKMVLEGELYQFPSILETSTLSIADSKYISIVDGKIMVTLRNDVDAKLIKLNNRAILMQRAWKVIGIDTSVIGLTTLYMDTVLISTTNDDLVNEIANKNLLATYSITTDNGTTISIDSTKTLQLNCIVNRIVDTTTTVVTTIEPIIYTSSDTSIGVVSETGLISFLKDGNVTIMATLKNHNTINYSIAITVAPIGQDNYSISITGASSMYQNDSIVYTDVVVNNGIITTDDVVWSLGSGDTTYATITSQTGTSATVKALDRGMQIKLIASLVKDNTITGFKIITLTSSY